MISRIHCEGEQPVCQGRTFSTRLCSTKAYEVRSRGARVLALGRFFMGAPNSCRDSPPDGPIRWVPSAASHRFQAHHRGEAAPSPIVDGDGDEPPGAPTNIPDPGVDGPARGVRRVVPPEACPNRAIPQPREPEALARGAPGSRGETTGFLRPSDSLDRGQKSVPPRPSPVNSTRSSSNSLRTSSSWLMRFTISE